MADVMLTVGAKPAAEWSQFKADVSKMANELDQLTNKPYEVKIKFNNASIEAMRKQIDELTKSLDKLDSEGSGGGGRGKKNLAMTYEQARKAIDDYYRAYTKLAKTMGHDITQGRNGRFTSQSGHYDELAKELNRTSDAYANVARSMSSFKPNQQAKLTDRMAESQRKYAMAVEDTANKQRMSSKQQYDAINKVQKAYQSIDTNLKNWNAAKGSASYAQLEGQSAALKQLEVELQNGSITAHEFATRYGDAMRVVQDATQSIKSAGTDHMTFFSRLKGLGAELAKFVSIQQVIRSTVRAFKDMAQTSMQIESSLAQIKVVTGATDIELQQFFQTSANLAKELGQNITDVAKSIEDFSRLG